MFFKIFVKLTGKYLCRSLSLITLRRAAFFQNETPTQLLYCEFFENNVLTVQIRTAASVFMERICNINKPYLI